MQIDFSVSWKFNEWSVVLFYEQMKNTLFSNKIGRLD